MPRLRPAPLRVVIVAIAGLSAATVAPLPAAPPTAFRVSPDVMRRFRPAPPPRPGVEPPPSATTAAPEPEREAKPAAPHPVPEANPAPALSTPTSPAPTPRPKTPASARTPSAPRAIAGAPAVPRDWTPRGANVTERAWRWVVVHHTATDVGSVEAIHRAHRRRKDARGNPWRGIGYHFLIGNGEGMPDGAVEATFRWRGQLSGAHAGRRAENELGVGVCLVGDFDAADPTPAQLASARRLIAFLRERYDLPAERVVPHGEISATACPGKRLTVATLLEDESLTDLSGATDVRPPTAGAALLSGPSSSASSGPPAPPPGLAAPIEPDGPSLGAPAPPAREASAPRVSLFPPRSGSQDVP